MATIVTRETGATAVNRTLTNAELDNNFINLNTDVGNKQPLDADLTAIAALAGTTGFLTKTAADTWALDTSTYATQTYVGTQIANLVASAPTTLDTLNELATALGNDANFSTTIATALGNKQPLDADLTAIAALTGTSGFLKKTAADTWALDTNTYLTSESDTLASVTGRGASTSSAITINNTITSSSTIQATNGRIALRDDSVENWATASDTAGIAVNYSGYAAGTSYFRDFSVYNGKGGLVFKSSGSGGFVYATGSFRAPIFYDNDDTNYFVNPTGSSIFHSGSSYTLELRSSQRYVGRFWNTSVSGYGFWLANDANTLIFHADSVGDVASLDSSGNFNAYGSSRAPIFYDRNDTGYYLDPAGTSLSASLNGPIVMSSTNWTGEVSGKIQYHSTSWYFQYASYFHFRNSGGGNTFWGDASGNTWSDASSRAPVFYDSNNTGYWIDPASGGGSSFNFAGGGYIHAYNNSGYLAFDNSGSYYGIIGNSSSNVWRLGIGSATGMQDWNFQWNNNGETYTNTYHYAQIFYDRNDSAYYLDPANTLLSLKVAGNIDLYARSASWAEGIRIRVPNTSSWGGIRWTRDRGNDDGNWALGYWGLDSSDDFILWANNSGDGGSVKFRITKAGTMTLNGAFNATSKSFLINHPTKPNMKLRYGSLEGPENGVYIRGKQRGNRIELPDYWLKLIDPDSITVTLTPVGKHQKLYVDKIENNTVCVGNDGLFSGEAHYFYVVYAERVDIEKLGVEIPA